MLASTHLLHAYEELLERFGPQGWWPIYRKLRTANRESENNVPGPQAIRLERHPCPKRLTKADRFQICVGAILTQNTAWTNVERALANLLNDGTYAPQALASMRRDRLARLIRPAGYFNQKARKLQVFSRWLLEQYDGSLKQFFGQATERCRAELLSFWGIGPETADSMLLYAGHHPVFVIDAYTKRWLAVSNVCNLQDWTYDECQRFFMDRLPSDAALYSEFHALLVAWGKALRTPAAVALDELAMANYPME